MNLRKSSRSNAGFSLVELMIVVAIIGVLASIAVPQFQKFIFKARQTEAKAGLSSIYSAEKAFYGEYTNYDSRFRVIGYAPEGKYYYNIGFAYADSQKAPNYTGSTTIGSEAMTYTWCALTASAGNTSLCQNMFTVSTTLDSNCTVVNPGVSDTADAQPTFLACAASAKVDPSGNEDYWTISSNKIIENKKPSAATGT